MLVFAGPQETQQIVSRVSGFSQDYSMGNNLVGTFDIVVCGGTLGIFLATALCAKGLRVAVVERNAIKGVKLLVNAVVEVWLEKLLLKLFGFVVI